MRFADILASLQGVPAEKNGVWLKKGKRNMNFKGNGEN